MKLKVLFFALTACLATACSEDPEGNSYNGTWKLTNATVTEGPSLEYTPGEVIWTFDEDSHRLTVHNNVVTLGPENIYSGLASGVYSYTVHKTDGINVLYVDGIKQGDMANTSENLVISSETQMDEGLKKVFSR
ncbi:hypothetical protein ACLI09_06325 [Flavobacterium sp. RHBU_24]|uniref:hypothetical protein n=1 Tax=Flavobacterium sp. RHBU_24 TaxID=3391185 RepID=UPI003984E5A5